jgi:peptidoglycan/xylan/chitin deacetylase (PgdA/CDA1 family)
MEGPDEFPWPGGARAAVSLTFDDARLSQVDLGFDVLERHGLRGSFYVSPENIEARLEAWRSAARRGHEIGNHTLSHPCSGNFPWSRRNALEDYTLDRMRAEILGASALIHERLGIMPVSFAYPCGQTFVGRGTGLESYVPLVAGLFLAGRAYDAEVANSPRFCDLAHLGSFRSDETSAASMLRLVDAALEQGRWLIFCGHEVGGGGFQTTLQGEFDLFCGRLRRDASRVWTSPLANVAAWIREFRISG